MKTPEFKLYKLDFIVLISGISVMVLELVGARILAPYVGTSMFVWASLIGVVLGSLTIGYYLGGYFSEKNPNLNFLSNILLISGVVILLLCFLKEDLMKLSLYFGVKSGSIFSSLILFSAPSILLGMVSPYAIRLKIIDVHSSGEVAGKLYALSTIGSIIGTFLAGFYLIPTFGSSQIMFGIAGTLIISALAVNFNFLKILIFIVFLGSSFFVFDGNDNLIIYETDSEYNHIRVADYIDQDNRPTRILYLATEAHSAIYRDSDELFPGYFRYYQLDEIFKPEIKTALNIGGGAYVGPINFLKRFPEAKITVVEIDPKVTEVAKKYFNLEENPRLNVVHADGRIFLNNNKEKFDVIYGDAFGSYYSVPFQLTTKEAMQKIYNSLNDDGIFLMNIISSIAGDGSIFFQSEFKTLSEIFPQLYVFPVKYHEKDDINKHQNIILVATKSSFRLSLEEMKSRANEKQKDLVKSYWSDGINLDQNIEVLTDNFAPVDYYISKIL